MPTNFQINIPLKGEDTVADVNRTTDEFPLHYTVSFSSGQAETEVLFYGTIAGPYDDPSSPQSEAFFEKNGINDPEAEAALAKAIVEHEKKDYPQLVPVS